MLIRVKSMLGTKVFPVRQPLLWVGLTKVKIGMEAVQHVGSLLILVI